MPESNDSGIFYSFLTYVLNQAFKCSIKTLSLILQRSQLFTLSAIKPGLSSLY